jgi:hypothetical protein
LTVVQLLVVVVGGSQLPLTHVQPVPGRTVVQLEVVVVLPGGSQPPFTHVQPVPGLTVLQVLPVEPVPVVGGSQLPFTHVQPVPGLTVVQLLVEVVVDGIQPPLTQIQFAPGCTVVQPPVLPPVPPVPPVPVVPALTIEPCATYCAMTFVKLFDAAATNFAVAPAATAGCVDSVVPELVSCACGPGAPAALTSTPHTSAFF